MSGIKTTQEAPPYYGLFMDIGDEDDINNIALVGRAISSPTRLQIIKLLHKESLTMTQIADKLNMPLSSTSVHLHILEESKLVGADYSAKNKGTVKWYTFPKSYVTVLLRLQSLPSSDIPPFSYNINIGDFVDAAFSDACGMATDSKLLIENQPNDVFTNERHDAQIIWSHGTGFIEYAIPNSYALVGEIDDINFSLELCSEARGYNHNYPSDITFWINDVELCTFNCPGDFGKRYGKYTPEWWFIESTKYGLLTNINIIESGVYLNGKLVNKHVDINKLDLKSGNRTTIKIGVKDDAVNKGGFNIFGEKFGDYNQAIVFNAVYKPKI